MFMGKLFALSSVERQLMLAAADRTEGQEIKTFDLFSEIFAYSVIKTCDIFSGESSPIALSEAQPGKKRNCVLSRVRYLDHLCS